MKRFRRISTLLSILSLTACFVLPPLSAARADIPPPNELEPFRRAEPPEPDPQPSPDPEPVPAPTPRPKQGCGSLALAEVTMLCVVGVAGVALTRIARKKRDA